ncbi:hypothetical protein VCRA2127O15_90104 [Vibrio crassostreae]|nr:hypothetical protein VCRA2127O15_90104 [Vibrio crassostreae]CAK3721590.1 hypothetical protein VCRA2123O13_80095 [Vibrio crassostreae]CAK3958122.1 hypothetical protein VCRA2120O6_70095 [Vibrio crassostreae]
MSDKSNYSNLGVNSSNLAQIAQLRYDNQVTNFYKLTLHL